MGAAISAGLHRKRLHLNTLEILGGRNDAYYSTPAVHRLVRCGSSHAEPAATAGTSQPKSDCDFTLVSCHHWLVVSSSILPIWHCVRWGQHVGGERGQQ